MKTLVEPDDNAIRSVGDLFKHGESFAKFTPDERACLARCFAPVTSRPLTELPSGLVAHLEQFQRPKQEGIPYFAAELLRIIWLRDRVYRALWADDTSMMSSVSCLIDEVGYEWDSILKSWSEDVNFPFEAFVVDVLLPNMELSGLLDWKLCSFLVPTGRRIPLVITPAKATFQRHPRHPLFWLQLALECLTNPPPNYFGLIVFSPDSHNRIDSVLRVFYTAFKSNVESCNWRACDEILATLQAGIDTTGMNVGKMGWKVYGEPIIQWFELMDARFEQIANTREALYLWFWLANHCFGNAWNQAGCVIDASVAKRIERAGQVQLGKLRSELHNKVSHHDWEFYDVVVQSILAFGSPWAAVKPLLLGLRELAEPAVARDLRHWPEAGKEPVPESLSCLPRWIGNLLGSPALRIERETDPELSTIRGEFAMFCLKRLKNREDCLQGCADRKLTNEDFVEPNPIWRACYARAAGELRINPQGSSHRIAYWSSQNDPDPMVREASGRLYDSLRHKIGLDPKLSPRRPLLAAFWWLRQAHLLSLGIEIDQPGAQRTRNKELRWTDRISNIEASAGHTAVASDDRVVAEPDGVNHE